MNWQEIIKTGTVFQRKANSRDVFSRGYARSVQRLRLEQWYDVYPFSLTLWPHYYSENIRRASWWNYRENYASIALELQLEGETAYYENNKKIILKPGEVYLTTPGQNVVMSNTSLKFGRNLQLIVSGGAVKLLVESLGLTECRHLDFSEPDKQQVIIANLTRIADLMRGARRSDAAENSNLGYQLLTMIADQFAKQKQPVMPALVTHAVNYMKSSPNRVSSVSQLAEELGTSRATLSRLFRQWLEISPQKYWNAIRMESAKQLIETAQFSFKEIAEELGFQNSLYFSTAFRNYTGQTPTEYKYRLLASSQKNTSSETSNNF